MDLDLKSHIKTTTTVHFKSFFFTIAPIKGSVMREGGRGHTTVVKTVY